MTARNSKALCAECGSVFNRQWASSHRKSLWHRIAKRAREMRRGGRSYEEIARELGTSRQYMWYALNSEDL